MEEDDSSQTSVFVSYAHKDMQQRSAVSSSRLGELLQDLAYALGADHSRARIRFLKDQSGVLRISDDIDERISEHIRIADIGLVCMSESYCNSESCEKELRELMALDKRIVLVELDDFWLTGKSHRLVALREDLTKRLTSRFWTELDGHVQLFGYPLPSTASEASRRDFTTALQRLADDIKTVAREMREARREKTGPAASAVSVHAPASHADVVIAAPTSDTRGETDRLEHAYADAGFSVLRLDRFDDEMTPENVGSALADAHVFVQILGAVAGRRLPGFDDRPSSVAQFNVAKQCGIETAVWVARDFDPDEGEPDYAAFLRSIVTHRTSFEDFERYSIKLIEEHLKRARSAERVQARTDTFGADAPLVSIDADKVDANLRDRIKTALDKHVDVTCIDYDADQEALSEAVLDNDAIVLVYGDQVAGQKRANSHFKFFRRWRKAIWNEDKQRFEIAVGDASPVGGTPCPSGPNIHVIRIDDDIDQRSMYSFLSALGVGTADAVQ